MSNIELNLNEMEEVTGGKVGSPASLAPTATFDVHKIKSGETLTQIASRYNNTKWRYGYLYQPAISIG